MGTFVVVVESLCWWKRCRRKDHTQEWVIWKSATQIHGREPVKIWSLNSVSLVSMLDRSTPLMFITTDLMRMLSSPLTGIATLLVATTTNVTWISKFSTIMTTGTPITIGPMRE